MMDDRRRRLGRFGLGQRLASAAAIAILAVSPAIVSVAGSHLDGVALAIAEAVFGEPVSAQECTDRNGNPRQCTATEKLTLCLMAGEDAFYQCIDALPWWGEVSCYAALALDTVACGVGTVGDVIIG